ncbi:MAG: aldo/keto reductase [Synergistaceae bacterium]|jgi:aryl-alcohol dehydrogenase-like predicted oxidoreductase|nr:aldo/keto reductase [Synergistaceae bacterium]
MRYTQLVKGLSISRSGFGALPIQRLAFPEAEALLRGAFDGGINFFDTARAYSDSEEKVGRALSPIRDQVVIATKARVADTPDMFWKYLETSLSMLKTDHIDIYQFHNPKEPPLADSPIYACMTKAREQGKIRFIGITNHRLYNAVNIIESGLYDTLQYPLSALSSDREIEMARQCGEHGMGFIAMKALCGGLLTSAAPSMAYLTPMPHVVPIWGFQRQEELDEVLALEKNPPLLDGEMMAKIERDREELGGGFCRGCGYCAPCAVGIEIHNCARMPFLLRRAPWRDWVTPEWQAKMEMITLCVHCGQCRTRCPYELDCPALLQYALKDYREFLKEKELS